MKKLFFPLLTVIASAPPACAQDATMFRGGPTHPGVYASQPVVHQPHIKWQFHTPGRLIGSPSIANATAYIGSTDGRVYAVDLSTGKERWHFQTGARVNSTPAIADGMVYFTSYDGKFYAVDAASGKSRWVFATKGERRFAGKHLHGSLPAGETMPDPYDVYLSSPAVIEDVVYFGSGDGNIYALAARTGELRWAFQTGDVVHASPMVSDGVVFVGSWDSYFYALNAANGAVRWKYKTGEDTVIHNQVGIQSSATIANGVVFFGCRDAHVYALDARTGKKRWAFGTEGSWVVGSPSVRNGVVYVGTSDSQRLLALNAESGNLVGSLEPGWLLNSSPAIAGNVLYIGSWNGTVTAVNLATLKPIWAFQTEASRANSARFTTPDGKMNYGAAQTENFYDAMIVGIDRVYTMGSILASPVLSDGVLYVASVDGNLYALE